MARYVCNHCDSEPSDDIDGYCTQCREKIEERRKLFWAGGSPPGWCVMRGKRGRKQMTSKQLTPAQQRFLKRFDIEKKYGEPGEIHVLNQTRATAQALIDMGVLVETRVDKYGLRWVKKTACC